MTPKRRIIPIFIPHLGCPHQCVFCNQRSISGTHEFVTGDTVRHALSAGFARIPAGEGVEIAFYGGSFTAIPVQMQEDLLNAALPFLRFHRENSIRISTRPDCVDGKVLRRLRSYGVTTVELGAQSMCDEVLQCSGRGHTAADTVCASMAVKESGFNLILQMMTGLPGGTREKSLYTARRLAELQPDGVRLYPTVVVRGTPLYNLWQRGAYGAQSIADAVAICAAVVPVFTDAGVPVIRIGLNPSEELSGGAAVAGAYHPAFGELVRSRIYLERAKALLCGNHGADEVTVGVHRSRVSSMVGHKKSNVDALRREYGIRRLKVVPADVMQEEIVILSIAK